MYTYMKRIACLISGLPRSFNYNIDKMKAVLGVNVDYFLHITENYVDKYKNKNIDFKQVIDKLKPVQVLTETDMDYKKNRFSNIKKQWYKLNAINNLRISYEKLNNIEYDIIIRIRPDIFVIDNIINFDGILDDIIYGRNDELFYGKSSTFNKVCKLIFDFDKNLENAYESTDIFFNHLKNQNIRLLNINLKYKLVLTECNIIAISGDSGCGKTTLINNIDKIFKEKTLKLEGDRYHKWERGDENWKKYTHLNPEANYICKMKEDIFNLKIGENIYQVDYDHVAGRFTEKQEIKSSKNILMCGLHSLYDDSINKMFNLKIFLDTDNNLKYYWKIKRDVSKRGYNIEQVLEKIRQREDDNIKFIQPQKKKSDIIIRFFTDNDFNYRNLDSEPNIYLDISCKKNIFNFLKILDKYSIQYSVIKGDGLNSIIFYKIFNDFKCVLCDYIKREGFIFENDFYTIILSFILFYNIEGN
jgi:uridine kinase